MFGNAKRMPSIPGIHTPTGFKRKNAARKSAPVLSNRHDLRGVCCAHDFLLASWLGCFSSALHSEAVAGVAFAFSFFGFFGSRPLRSWLFAMIFLPPLTFTEATLITVKWKRRAAPSRRPQRIFVRVEFVQRCGRARDPRTSEKRSHGA